MATLNEHDIVNVNAHLHTPYSFSAFDSIAQALDMAASEGVKVVGINDFYSTDGYGEWNDECQKRKLYPLFNIEFISLQAEDQVAGIRVNDPNNPGRTYLSGKGLAHPARMSEPYRSMFRNVREESNAHVAKMCGKLNEILASTGAGFTLDIADITKRLTNGSVRERHLAKALRIAVYNRCAGDTAKIKVLLEKIFGGKEVKSDISDYAALENEIRNNLLKAGGRAFVPEDPKAFLPFDDVCKIILDGGGIPTYPFLADDSAGNFTDFERDVVLAAQTLKKRGICSVEFITTRNSVETLERYAGYLSENGFIVTFGSEHNTPAMEPITLTARKGTALTPLLRRIGYEGACVVAAHQHLVSEGKEGYTCSDPARKEELIAVGNKLIHKAIG